MTPETERQMDFYSHARADGLARRVEMPFEMTETFEDRPDFMYHRHVVFGKRIKVFGPSNTEVPDQGQRPLQVILLTLHDNNWLHYHSNITPFG